MQQLINLAKHLRLQAGRVAMTRVVAGFDGFVDQLIQVVDERRGLGDFSPVPTIARFAGLMGEAAGRSSLREIVVRSVDAGGCAVNLGDGIAGLGVQLDYFGTLGEPLHPAFADFAARCATCTSWGREPGLTLALEFQDGKYMLSSVAQLAEFDVAEVRKRLADGRFASACAAAPLIAFTNWTLYPHMSAVWSLLQESVLAKLSHRPWLFIDLVDPRSRSRADIEAMLMVLRRFEGPCRTVFGGNLNEANAVCAILGLPTVADEGPAVAEQAARLRERLGVSEVAIHCLKGAAVAAADGCLWGDGPYTPTPKKSTGAGDRFNSGYCLGRILDLPAADRLRLGGACSGFFVRNARSGSLAEVADVLESWGRGSLAD
jgi:hypothetical protein